MVYGDTNSTLAGALAAAKLHVPVAHVEAGFRSFNRRMPEELNRVIADHHSDVLFTPTDTATARFFNEGIPFKRIRQVGDVMYDAALYYGQMGDARSDMLRRDGLECSKYVLATIHRAENIDDPNRLNAIVAGLERVASKLFPVVFPPHTRTRSAMQHERIEPVKIQMIEPVGYLDMVALESGAAVIATDSGGIQKEAYFHWIPRATLREETEWIELVEMGWNELAPPWKVTPAKIIQMALCPKCKDNKPYGSGDAAKEELPV